MAKTYYEIAADITQELIRARGVALSGIDSAASVVTTYAQNHLSDEAAVKAYKEILQAVKDGFND
ncbi:hypothetical protein MKX34_17290 [Paenibacillus sp. FSL R5-0636]|uniref:hypothetical protein n=1 Tax=Paenibacillus TaxID=44249 RepID=UPI00096E2FBB|nr:hypothetical protein [Paenibacillus odorifer]OMD03462.1 hypothetical protein BJP49_01215 [Paenibacillus odorifer]